MRILKELTGPKGLFTDGDWIETKDQDPEGTVRLIQLADIGDGVFRNRSNRYMTKNRAEQLGCTFLRPGDVLIARMPEPLGRACIFPGIGQEAVTAVDVCILRSAPGIDRVWLMHVINAPQFRRRVLAMQSGTTRKRISRKNLSKIELPIRPHDEQVRIREDIEKNLTCLDSAKDEIADAGQKLELYRRSVLAAAVLGRLSKRGALSPTLQEVLELRAADGMEGSRKNKTSPVPSVGSIVVPSEWTVASLEQATSSSRPICYGILKPRVPAPGSVRYVEVRDLQQGRIDQDLNLTSKALDEEFRRSRLRSGDVLIAIRGSYDRSAVVPDSLEGANISRDVARIVPLPILDPSFLSLYLQSPVAHRYFASIARGSAVKGLNIRDLRAMPVPIPHMSEQLEIVGESERLLSLADDLATHVDHTRQRGMNLRRSILSKAFSGTLRP